MTREPRTERAAGVEPAAPPPERAERVDAPSSIARPSVLGRLASSYRDGLLHAGYPSTYGGAGKPQFGRPDGQPPLAEDDHVAHAAPADGMGALRDFLLSRDIPPAGPRNPRWRGYRDRPDEPGGPRDDD